jgi:pimeloyl-ACP methyl ester carboxylesterase
MVKICLLFCSVPAWSVDILTVLEWRADLGARWSGFRQFELQDPEDSTCQLNLVRHLRWSPDKPTHVALMGFGDSRVGIYPWLDKLREARQTWILEWPRLGASQCDQAQSLRESALRVERVLKKQNLNPATWIGVSLGALLTLELSPNWPQSRMAWIAPPFINLELAQKLKTQISQLDSTQAVQEYMKLILTEPQELPDFVLSALLKRIKRSQILIKNADFESLRLQLEAQTKNLAPKLWIQAEKDRLFPDDQLHPEAQILAKKDFVKTLSLAGCGHDLNRSCANEIAKALNEFIPDESAKP